MRRIGLGRGHGACAAVIFWAIACSHEPAPVPVVVPVQPPQTAPTSTPSAPPPPSPKSVELATDEAPAAEPPPPQNTEDAAYIAARDPRAKGTPRQVTLVETEVRGLEALNNQASTPQLARRLMDGYAEIARLHTGAAASQARTRSIAQADKLITSYPTYAALDEVRYYRALAYEQNGDLRQARMAYYDLIKFSPNSKFIPHTYFAFGEMFFTEAQNGDPSKFDLAKQAYREAVKYPPATNSVHDFAKKKLAQIPGGAATPPPSNFQTRK